jgi:hypothetical protein
MGAFNINITGVGGHGCERKAKPGEKLHGRCGRFTCPDCMAYEFVQRMKQAGMLSESGTAQGNEIQPGSSAPVDSEEYEVDGKRYWRRPHRALFTHWPGELGQVVDDMLKNERRSGAF